MIGKMPVPLAISYEEKKKTSVRILTDIFFFPPVIFSGMLVPDNSLEKPKNRALHQPRHEGEGVRGL